MKIKQSFIDRCGEITVNELVAISSITGIRILSVTHVILYPEEYEHTNEVLKAAANVLKINLSDIYETEQLPNTHNEIF